MYNGFFDRRFYLKASPPPSPGSGIVGGEGGGGSKKKTRFERESTTQYSQSFLFISETINKGYQMIISKLNESVICFG